MPQEQCRKYIHTHPGNIQKGEDATSQSNRPKKPNEDRVTIKKHRVTNTRTRLLVLVSPPHQVRTAADTASKDDSCGHRRCWTAAASKGLFCLVCVVLVLVAVCFASWTMMAVPCFSVDDFVLFFFRSTALLILVLVSPPHQVCTAADTAGNDTVSYTHLRAHETDSYLVCRLLLEKKK